MYSTRLSSWLVLKKVAKDAVLERSMRFWVTVANNVDVETSERTRRVYRWWCFFDVFLFFLWMDVILY